MPSSWFDVFDALLRRTFSFHETRDPASRKMSEAIGPGRPAIATTRASQARATSHECIAADPKLLLSITHCVAF